MNWRRVTTGLVGLAYALALVLAPMPASAGKNLAALPCHEDGSTPAGGTQDNQLPCCAPVCCVPLHAAFPTATLVRVGTALIPAAAADGAAVVIGPGERPPRT